MLPRGFVICFALKRNCQEVNFERLRKDKHILNVISSKINKPTNERKVAHSVCFQKLVINGHLKLTSKFQFVKINIVPNVSLLYTQLRNFALVAILPEKASPRCTELRAIVKCIDILLVDMETLNFAFAVGSN